MSYDTLLARRILGPLGMTHTTNGGGRGAAPGRAVDLVPAPAGVVPSPEKDFSALIGAGSVWSDARDIARFTRAVAHGDLGPGPQRSFVRHGTLDFNGRDGGFKAWALWDSTTDVTVVMLSNLATGAPDQLKHDALALVAGRAPSPPAEPAPRPTPLTADEVRPWLGRYRLGESTTLRLHWRDGALWSNDWVLRPTADGRLFSPRDFGNVRVVTGPDGRAERLEWEQQGTVYPAPRIGD